MMFHNKPSQNVMAFKNNHMLMFMHPWVAWGLADPGSA